MIGCLVLPYFYTEAEARRRPELAGRAAIIHHRGRAFALSPEAEETGLSQGMPLGQAYAICPKAVSLPYDEDLSRAAHKDVLDICAAYTSGIEPLSLHEIFLDLAGAGDPSQVMAEIAEAVMAQAGFTCHGGAGSSKLVGRIAALHSVRQACPRAVGRRDPSAMLRTGACPTGGARPESRSARHLKMSRPLIIPKGCEAQFLAPLPLSRLWLLDEDTIEHLEALGITTIGLLQQTPIGSLVERFGRMGRRLSEFAFGIDRSPVRACYPPPVIEARLSLAGDVNDMTAVEAALHRLARKVALQLRAREQGCRRIGLELETNSSEATSHWLRVSTAITSEGEVFRAAERLLTRALEPARGRARSAASIAALTLRAADLQHCVGVQLDLLGERELEDRRRERLTEVVTSAHKRFGARSVRWAREVEVPRRERMLACLRER